MKRKCRAICPWSKTASPFMDYWTKLCNKLDGHTGMHKSVNGALWSEEAFSAPPGMIAAMGYSDRVRVHISERK